MDHVIAPTVEGMAAEGHPYTGFLYVSLMIAPDGTAKVLEYNCRFGDPETQPIMMRLQSDLVELCLAACDKQLEQQVIDFDPRATVGVVMAAGGYPDNYAKGKAITGLAEADTNDTKVFHAGTKRLQDGSIVTSGGRVLCVTAIADSVQLAQQKAYAGVSKIKWEDAYYRTDIAHRAIAREQ